ncbi:gluconokinase [Nesterenkonia marinintestina]|uniref:gluconokinase n=1 Tax=Nesterenkonia marinintestina TaxID=2979865 RepID=UPI0021BFDCFA|nr:gluconokinase [Nesterenkonia sp. GX14115]
MTPPQGPGPGAHAGARPVVVMGVSGCGKSTVGELLAEELDGEFLDGDTLHPPENIEKMSAGRPLDDDDRLPWLREIAEQLHDGAQDGPLVVACSALKRSYRDLIREGAPEARFVHLHADMEVLTERLGGRRGHFMPAELLQSQFAALEPLAEDEDGRVFDVARTPEEIVAAAATWLQDG